MIQLPRVAALAAEPDVAPRQFAERELRDEHRARAIELGVDDYLGKPYQEAQLLEAIAPLVTKRRGEFMRQA